MSGDILSAIHLVGLEGSKEIMVAATHPGIRIMQTGHTSVQKAALVLAALAVVTLSFGPMFWMARTLEERYIILCASLPLCGVCFAWAWRERRKRAIRFAALTFFSAFSLWVFFLFYYLFIAQDERRGLTLLAANLLTNGMLFGLLNHQTKNKDREDPMAELAVL